MTAITKPLRALFGAIFLDQTTITLTFPLITLIFFDPQSRLFAHDVPLATRSFWYGICVALPNIINLFFAPLLSALSDEFGRKKILLMEVISAIFFTLALGCGVYFGLLPLIFIGFVIRGAFCRTNPTALTIIGDSVSEKQKTIYMGYLQFAIAIGASCGPVLGGYFATRYFFPTLNFALPFFIAAAIAMLNAVITSIFMRETLKQPRPLSFRCINIRAIKQVFLQREVLAISAILLLIQFSWSAYYQFIPPILKSIYHFSPHQLGIFMGMIAVWLAIATTVGLRLLHRFLSTKQLLLFSCYLIFIGFALTLFAMSQVLPTVFLWVGMAPIAAGDVMSYSCLVALYSNVVPHEKQGKVMGIGFMVVGLIWAATGFFGGLAMGISPFLPLMIAPLGVVVALILMHSNRQPNWVMTTATSS